MLQLDYREVFDQRGAAYHRAMQRYPFARAAEFARLFDRQAVEPGETILDIPAGGGYLQRHLPDARLTSLELTEGFGAGVPVVSAASDWPVGRFDQVICLAALHHIQERDAFIERLLTHATGFVHLADVGCSSPIGRFLDGFVGAYNGTGHNGLYLPDRARDFGFADRILHYGELDCPWRFDDEASMLDFCGGLFGLIDCPAEDLWSALNDYVGVRRDADGITLLWRLTYVDLRAG